MSLDEKFTKAAQAIHNIQQRPSDAELLEIYALYKQATVGDVNIDKPKMTDLKGKAKYDAWNSKKGLNKDSAKEQYVVKATSLGASL